MSMLTYKPNEMMPSRADLIILEQQKQLAELERELAGAKATMMAAAVEIQEHWDAHCDDEGYGPANLMRRLEEGFCAAGYAYTAETVVNLRKQIERMKPVVEAAELAYKSCFTEGGDIGNLEDKVREYQKEE